MHGGIRIGADDREALKRLLAYCTRPALSPGRLQYRPDQNLIRYRPKKTRPGEPPVLQWSPTGFIRSFVPILPPPYLNLVRYSGALGPRSRLRTTVAEAAKQKVACPWLLEGWVLPRLPAAARRGLTTLATAAAKAWALCLRKVFEAYPMLCSNCGSKMKVAAVITNDQDIVEILSSLRLPADFPVLKHARAPPDGLEGDSQVDPNVEDWEGIDPPHPED